MLNTDAPPSVSFDFAQAVEWARENFPAQTARVVFVDKATPKKAAQQLRGWLDSTCADFRDIFLNGMTADDFVLNSLTQKQGGSFAECDPVTGNGVLALRGRKTAVLKDLTGPAMRHHHFMHEMGHLVVPGGIYTTLDELALWCQRADYWASVAQTHRHEVAADAFSFLTNIPTGALTAAQAETLCLEDAALLWMYPGKTSIIEHMTLRGMDDIILRAQDADALSLSPSQKAAIAAEHARHYAMSAEEAAGLQADIRRLKTAFEKNATRLPRLPKESFAPVLLQKVQEAVHYGRIITPFE